MNFEKKLLADASRPNPPCTAPPPPPAPPALPHLHGLSDARALHHAVVKAALRGNTRTRAEAAVVVPRLVGVCCTGRGGACGDTNDKPNSEARLWSSSRLRRSLALRKQQARAVTRARHFPGAGPGSRHNAQPTQPDRTDPPRPKPQEAARYSSSACPYKHRHACTRTSAHAPTCAASSATWATRSSRSVQQMQPLCISTSASGALCRPPWTWPCPPLPPPGAARPLAAAKPGAAAAAAPRAGPAARRVLRLRQ